jgi:hypothetical protein
MYSRHFCVEFLVPVCPEVTIDIAVQSTLRLQLGYRWDFVEDGDKLAVGGLVSLLCIASQIERLQLVPGMVYADQR